LLLNNTKLGNNAVAVTLVGSGEGSTVATSSGGLTAGPTHEETSHTEEKDSEGISQDDKPRSAIFAEYLAHGYVIGDSTLTRAIELDKTHGISTKFTSFLTQLDTKLKATDRAKSADTTYGITDKATTGWNTLNQYFEKAIDTPTGQKVRAFYTEGSKQVLDIHTEARRLAELKKQQQAEKTGTTSEKPAESTS
jgi:hypothetical protein